MRGYSDIPPTVAVGRMISRPRTIALSALLATAALATHAQQPNGASVDHSVHLREVWQWLTRDIADTRDLVG